MILFFESLKETKDMYLYYLLATLIIGDTIDFTFGWLNARFNNDVVFQSRIALHGIIKKSMSFLAMAFMLPVAFAFLDTTIAYTSLTILYLGYIASTLNSIGSHLGWTKDGKNGSLFIDFLKTLKGDNKQ